MLRSERLDSAEAVVRSYFCIPLPTEYSHHDDVAFSKNGQSFAVIGDSQDIMVFRTNGGQLQTSIKNRKYKCDKLVFHETRDAIYLNSKNEVNHAARLLNIQTNGFDRYFVGHTAQITSLVSTQTGVITSSLDKTIRVWDDRQEKNVASLNCEPSNIALHPNGRCLVVVSQRSVSLYDIRKLDAGRIVTRKTRVDRPLVPHLGMQGKSLMLVGSGRARQYSLKDLSCLSVLDDSVMGENPGFAFTPDEKFFVMPSDQFMLLIVDSTNGQGVTALKGHDSVAKSIAFSSAYHNFVSVGNECLLWTVDMETYHSMLR